MFGHGCPLVEPDFCVGAGVGVVLVGAGVVVDELELVGAAAAVPEAAPAEWATALRAP